MYSAVYSNLVNYAKNEGFVASRTGTGGGLAVGAALLVLLLVVIQLLVVQWLWNTVLVRVVTVVRPIPSLLYTLGILVLIAMVLPGSV